MNQPSSPTSDPAHDVLRSERQRLDRIFRPRSVAVLGASEMPGSPGRTVLGHLLAGGFTGTLVPITPHLPAILGLQAYPRLADVAGRIDLAVIVEPAAAVHGAVRDCAAAGVPGVIITSGGFRDNAPGGSLTQQILEDARRGGVRMVGPDSVGVMLPHTRLNASMVGTMARPGSVGFVSQSGALGSAILDWSFRVNVGFSAFISVGGMLDVGWGDVIDYLGDDPQTQSIVIYMESIGDARSFLSAAREVALSKPIIVLKAGRTDAAARIAVTHTGWLAGDDAALDAAFRRCGVLRVSTIADLFYMAGALSKQPRPAGPRLTIITNAGGPAVIATDALIANGGELSPLSEQTSAALAQALPTGGGASTNPIDLGADADPEQYARAVDIALKDPATDGVLVIVAPQAMTEPARTAERLKPYARTPGKPILASMMGGLVVEAGEEILNEANIPTFAYPDTAARVFDAMWRRSYNLHALYQTPMPAPEGEHDPNREQTVAIIGAAQAAGRTLLTEAESKAFLAAYGIPVVATHVAHSAEEAVAVADGLGYPVVLKLLSSTIVHKSDVGGVQLNLPDAEAVRRAYDAIRSSAVQHAGETSFGGVTVQAMVRTDGYELLVGSTTDPDFGPVMLFGSGGRLVEVYADRAAGLPPLNTTLARRMMEQTRVFAALRGEHGRAPVDLAALEQLLVRFSYLLVEQPRIKEIDINPLLASSSSLVALDARIVLHDRGVPDDQLPRPAIRPYPSRYVSQTTLKDGTPVTIRPIRPEDEPLMVRFHQTLSERSVYLRYFHPIKLDQRITHERLIRICFIDYDREMALVVERKEPASGEQEIVAVGRLSKRRGTGEAEFALLISDLVQGQGLGTALLSRLVQIGRDEGVRHITAEILPDNRGMRRVAEKLGFRLRFSLEDGVVKAALTL